MTSKTLKPVLILLFITLVLLIICGCETEESYTTIIRMNPDGSTEEWKTCSGVTWGEGGLITFTPLELSHTLQITGALTVYKTIVIVAKDEEEPDKEE